MESQSRLSAAARPAPRLPDGAAVYAVGDVHGCAGLLDLLQAAIEDDAAALSADRRWLVYLGDYVDRGPDAKGVIDRLIAGPPPGFEQVALLGNHDAWMLDFLDDARHGAGWLANGGGATLESYGVKSRNAFGPGNFERMRDDLLAALPAGHRAFLETLRPMWRLGDYAFVHAGVRPGVPLDRQDLRDLIWIRGEFLDAPDDFGACVVHGHSISPAPEVRGNRIGVDTGAFATGRLTCLVLHAAERRFLQT